MADETEAPAEPKRPPPPKIEAVVLAKGVAPTGRYTRTVTVRSESSRFRDNNKVFLLTEMPAAQGEEWAVDALNALASNGVDIGGVPMSMAGMHAMGVMSLGRIPREALHSLLATMFACVQIVPNPQAAPNLARPLTPDDIEEVPTRFLLRNEVFNLHVDFLEPDARMTSQTTMMGAPGSHSTQMSHQPSAPLSRQVERR
jgi:hypothetical protein